MQHHLIRLASAPFIFSRFPCAMCGKRNAEFMKGAWELWSYFKPFVDQSSQNFSDDIGSPCTFQRPFPIFCVTFHSVDICHWISKSSKNGANAKVFWPPIFVGGTAPTFLRQFFPSVCGSSIYRAGAQNKTSFVYFGMHGALPVYSLRRSRVEGKVMIKCLSYIMLSDSTPLWSCPCQTVCDPCQTPPLPASLFTVCATLHCRRQFTFIWPTPPGAVTG